MAPAHTTPPGKRAAASPASSDGKRQKLTYTVLPPVRTGNRLEEQMADTEFVCLQGIFDDLLKDRELVMPMFKSLQEHKKKLEARCGVDIEGSASFDGILSLSAVDDNFKIAFITSVSDLSSSDLVDLCKGDAGCMNDLIMYATQVPLKPKLPPKFMVKDVLRKFLEDRHVSCGERLKSFKANGGVVNSKLVFNKNHGCYSLKVDPTTKLVTEISHISGTKKAVDKKLSISCSYMLQDNFDDMGAHLRLPPMPPIRLHTFFTAKQKEGPYSYPTFVGKPKDLAKSGDKYHDDYEKNKEKERKKLTASAQVVEQIHKNKKEAQKGNMDKVREQALKAIERKRSRRSLELE